MKKAILLFAGILLAAGAQAQITLNVTGYPVSVIGTDSLSTTTVASAFPALTASTSGMWDMSIVTDTSQITYAHRITADTAAYQFADSNFYSFSGNAYQGNVQSSITSGGLIEYGVDIDSATYVVSGATIYIPIQHNIFTSPYTVIQFPATMNSSWSSNYESDFNFNITYSPLYSNTPGIIKSFITEKDTVVGWGQMRVKNQAGSPSSWFNVLQVKTTITVTDSFLIGGSVPIAPVLSALGVTEGQVTTQYEQNYYRAGEVTPFAQVQYPDNTFATPSKATTHTQRLINTTGVASVVNNSGVTIYPNPVTNNIVSIDLPATGGAWAYELIDMSGKTVTSGALQTSGSHAQLSMPSSVTPGIYYISLANNGKQVCVRSIEIAK